MSLSPKNVAKSHGHRALLPAAKWTDPIGLIVNNPPDRMANGPIVLQVTGLMFGPMDDLMRDPMGGPAVRVVSARSTALFWMKNPSEC